MLSRADCCHVYSVACFQSLCSIKKRLFRIIRPNYGETRDFQTIQSTEPTGLIHQVKCIYTRHIWGQIWSFLSWQLSFSHRFSRRKFQCDCLSKAMLKNLKEKSRETSNTGTETQASPHLASNLFPFTSNVFYEKSLKQKWSGGAIMSSTNLIPYYHKPSAMHA